MTPATRRKAKAPARAPYFWRGALLIVAVTMCAGVAGARFTYLNTVDSEELRARGDYKSISYRSQPVLRGTIYDRNGELLAISTPLASVVLNPKRLDIAPPQLEALAKILETSPRALSDRIADVATLDRAYLKRKIPVHDGEQVVALGIRGIWIEREYGRSYPARESAAHLIGRTNAENEGQMGLELFYDNHLKGQVGRKRVLVDRDRNVIRELGQIEPPQTGGDLWLTIDARLQHMAYQALARAVRAEGAQSGSLVLLDAATAEVLALVNEPSYNPNVPFTGDFGRLRNRAVIDRYEPGSTIKPLAVIAALESGDFDLDSVVDTAPGWIMVSGKRIEDPRDRGRLTLKQVVAKSSQVGITKIALQLAPQAIPEVLNRVGLGEAINLGWPIRPYSLPPNAAHQLVRATMSYGYGFAVSPLQLAAAYQVLANNGVRHEVSLVRGGKAPRHAVPAPVGMQVIDRQLVGDLTGLLEAVVAIDGTAPLAQVPGYRVAGKTGTVRKVGKGGYDDTRHVAYFAGFAPASNPRFAMVVVIDEPKSENAGGGRTAGPVFGEVAAEALRLMQVPMDNVPAATDAIVTRRDAPFVKERT